MEPKLGKRPPTYDRRDLRYADVRPSQVPSAPRPGGGYGMDFGQTGWLMLGNGPDDSVYPGFGGCGNCYWAGSAHDVMESDKNAGRPVAPFSASTVVGEYSDYTRTTGSGYDPRTGANDDGTDVREGLRWRQQKGLRDDTGAVHKIGSYVALEPGNVEQLWEALWLFEAVGIGLDLPGSAMDQFDAGQVWSVVPGSPSAGLHWVVIVGHPTANIWTCVTWGCRQTMTGQFLQSRCDEAWAWIDPERYCATTGKTHEGWRDADLERYLTAIATLAS